MSSILLVKDSDIYRYDNHLFGDKLQLLACKWKGFIDLNKKYNRKNPTDCLDPITGLLYQISGRVFDRMVGAYGGWGFSHHDRDYNKEFAATICFCLNKDRKYIERIYIFPKEEYINRVSIVKNPRTHPQWYEKYRLTDGEELKIVNEIWQKIINEGL